MTVKVLEKETIGQNCYQNFECIPSGEKGSSIIRIRSDLLGVVGVKTFLEHKGSQSLGFDCLEMNAVTRRCSLNGRHCEQVPDSIQTNPVSILAPVN